MVVVEGKCDILGSESKRSMDAQEDIYIHSNWRTSSRYWILCRVRRYGRDNPMIYGWPRNSGGTIRRPGVYDTWRRCDTLNYMGRWREHKLRTDKWRKSSCVVKLTGGGPTIHSLMEGWMVFESTTACCHPEDDSQEMNYTAYRECDKTMSRIRTVVSGDGYMSQRTGPRKLRYSYILRVNKE